MRWGVYGMAWDRNEDEGCSVRNFRAARGDDTVEGEMSGESSRIRKREKQDTPKARGRKLWSFLSPLTIFMPSALYSTRTVQVRTVACIDNSVTSSKILKLRNPEILNILNP